MYDPSMRIHAAVALTALLGCHTSTPADVPQWQRVQVASYPALGTLLPGCGETSRMQIVAASAQTWPACKATYAGIEYIVGVDKKGTIHFLQTDDDAFATPEGLRVGSTVAQVVAAGAWRPQHPELGWGYHTRLPSGWSAYFGHWDAKELPSDATVEMFFKRSP
jgi:hypothetical protein